MKATRAALHEPAPGTARDLGSGNCWTSSRFRGQLPETEMKAASGKREWVTPSALSICSDAGWAPGSQAPPGKPWDSGLLFPHSPETRMCSCTRTKHTVRHSGGPSARTGDSGSSPQGQQRQGSAESRTLGGQGLLTLSLNLKHADSVLTGSEAAELVGRERVRAGGPGDPGIPEGRCRGEGFQAVDARRGHPGCGCHPGGHQLQEGGLCDRRVPPHLWERGNGQGASSSSPRGPFRAMAPLASVAGDLEWGVWALGRSEACRASIPPALCLLWLLGPLSVLSSLTPIYVQIQLRLHYGHLNLGVATPHPPPPSLPLSPSLKQKGTPCSREPVRRDPTYQDHRASYPRGRPWAQGARNPGPAFVAGVAGRSA